MSKKEIKTKELIREYLLNEGLLRENLPDPQSKFEFGFIFSFPPGQEKQKMSVFKLKNKNFIIIVLRTQLSQSHIKFLQSSKDDIASRFFRALRRFFIIKEVYFRIELQNYRYEINDQIFINKDGYISKNKFYNSIKKLFYCFIYRGIFIRET
ncbi:MAG: DUF2299 family protein [Promethearchaeota archaeon]